ncbi:hypothetical protein ACN27F_13670 [Solwaraspora sp. WMMB335]|uniref:hypothetical protein n=1 Tax=Solwaraspora sp. WMMB335 TaxID=3404118 RepID=UPI003B93B24E
MIAAIVATFAMGALSAVLPVTPIEPYLVALTATSTYDPVALGVAAAAGQTIPKLGMFLAARGVIRSPRVNKWLAKRTATRKGDGRETPGRVLRLAHRAADRLPERARSRLAGWSKWLAREHRRLYEPAFVAPTLFVSAVVGVPPLLVTSVVAGGTRMPGVVFTVVCFVGRSIRFVALAKVPGLFLD